MFALSEAATQRSVDAFLECFSRTRPFLLTSTDHERNRMKVSYKQLAAGMAPDGDFRDVMFGDDGGDNIAAFLASAGKWTLREPLTFWPEGQKTPPIFVRWANERGRYVVAEIAFPH